MQLCGSLSILWHCLSLGLQWKLTFSSPVATAEFSKFAGILSAALRQHHLSGFERAQREFHHLSFYNEWINISKCFLGSLKHFSKLWNPRKELWEPWFTSNLGRSSDNNWGLVIGIWSESWGTVSSNWAINLLIVVFQLLSCVWLFATRWTAACKTSCPSPSPGAGSNSCPLSVMPSNHLILCCPLLLLLSIFPSIRSFLMSQVAKVLELQLQRQSFPWIFRIGFLLDWLVWSACSPRNSQESSLGSHT